MIPGTPGGGDDRIFGFTMYMAPGYENIKGVLIRVILSGEHKAIGSVGFVA